MRMWRPGWGYRAKLASSKKRAMRWLAIATLAMTAGCTTLKITANGAIPVVLTNLLGDVKVLKHISVIRLHQII